MVIELQPAFLIQLSTKSKHTVPRRVSVRRKTLGVVEEFKRGEGKSKTDSCEALCQTSSNNHGPGVVTFTFCPGRNRANPNYRIRSRVWFPHREYLLWELNAPSRAISRPAWVSQRLRQLSPRSLLCVCSGGFSPHLQSAPLGDHAGGIALIPTTKVGEARILQELRLRLDRKCIRHLPRMRSCHSLSRSRQYPGRRDV